jgi:hypothetical protein
MPRRKALGKPDQPVSSIHCPITGKISAYPAAVVVSPLIFPVARIKTIQSLNREKTMETLKFLLQSKKADSTRPHDVVSDATAWMRQQFHNAGIAYHYADGGAGYGVYGYFQIKSLLKETAITLHVKIAEINGVPFAAAEVRVRGQHEGILFPYFGEIASEEGKLFLLHFIADFMLSTTPDLRAL